MYIANRPVRFDRNYQVGEIIPEAVISPGAAQRLVNTGRIIRIADPEPEVKPAAKEPQEHTEEPTKEPAKETRPKSRKKK